MSIVWGAIVDPVTDQLYLFVRESRSVFWHANTELGIWLNLIDQGTAVGVISLNYEFTVLVTDTVCNIVITIQPDTAGSLIDMAATTSTIAVKNLLDIGKRRIHGFIHGWIIIIVTTV